VLPVNINRGQLSGIDSCNKRKISTYATVIENANAQISPTFAQGKSTMLSNVKKRPSGSGKTSAVSDTMTSSVLLSNPLFDLLQKKYHPSHAGDTGAETSAQKGDVSHTNDHHNLIQPLSQRASWEDLESSARAALPPFKVIVSAQIDQTGASNDTGRPSSGTRGKRVPRLPPRAE
jgi:hypothetical protein